MHPSSSFRPNRIRRWSSILVCVSIAAAGCSSSSSTVTSPSSVRCPVQLAATPTSLDAAGGTGQISVAVNRDCTWDARSEADWITLTAPTSGQGDGTLRFAAAANAAVASRRGVVVVNDQRIELGQSAAACRFDLSAPGGSVAAAGGSLAVSVTAQVSCRWSTGSEADWIRVESSGDREGNGVVQLSVSANPGPARQGVVLIAGTRYTVSQAAAGGAAPPPQPLPPPGCSYVLTPDAATFPSAGGEATVTVQTSSPACTWTAASTVGWMTVGTPSGAGTATVRLIAAGNAGAERSGLLQIAGLTIPVSQAAAPAPNCDFSVAPRSAEVGSSGGEGTIAVQAATGSCGWSATSNTSWITVNPRSGTGSGEVRYAAAANTGAARSGTISVAGVVVTIAQAAAPAPPPCEYDVAPRSESLDANGGERTIRVRSGGSCAWTATSNASWIAVTSASGSGNGDVRYTVAANTGGARSGTITVGGVTVTISQEGPATPACQLNAAPRNDAYSPLGGGGTIRVTASGPTCAWTATSNVSWISVGTGSGTGEGEVRYTVAPNFGAARTGTLTVAGITVTISQAAFVPTRVSLSGALGGVSGSCPNLSFTLENREVRTNASTDFQRGDCDWFRSGRAATVDGFTQFDGTVLALRLRRGDDDD